MTEFRRSSFCGGGGCVEVAFTGDFASVRDFFDPGPELDFTRNEWEAFVAGVKAGEFDWPE